MKFENKLKKGFLSLAAILLMLTSLAIVTALLFRSIQGRKSVGLLQQSNQTYQDGDTKAEVALRSLRSVDNHGSVNGIDYAKKIPENTDAFTFCDGLNIICYDASGHRILAGDATRLSEVFFLSAKEEGSSTSRAIKAIVPVRISKPNVTISALFSGGHNVTVSWDADIMASSGDGEEVEVRRALVGTSLNNTSADWTFVQRTAISESGLSIVEHGVPSGSYVYTLKITNKNPLLLDSLYITPSTPVTVP